MTFEHKVRTSFKKAKDDVEGLKNELAFALRRIAKIEESMNKGYLDSLTSRKTSKKKI